MFTASRRADVFRPPRHIREKISTTGGVPLEEALGNASAVLMRLQGGFSTESNETVAKLQAAFQAAEASGGDTYREALYDCSHAVRGSGATFGYPLATRVADALCKFIDDHRSLTATDVAVIGVHVQAIRAVFAQGMTGDGGAAGRDVLPMLQKLRARV